MIEAWKNRVTSVVTKLPFADAVTSGQYATPRFSDLSAFKSIERHRKVGDIFGIENPFFRSTEGRQGRLTLINGKPCLNFSWCDYLGLSQHPDLIAAAKSAIDQYGTCISASRMVAGDMPLHRELEQEIATTVGVDAALVFVSGHAANISTIGTLMSEGDLIVHDEFVHNSAVVGMKLSRATIRSFRHNRLEALETILRKERGSYRNVLVVVEGLYSTEGDVPDLPRLIEIKQRYGAWLMVDDAHGAGVLGLAGRGCAEHFGLDARGVDIWMGTLSKTYASCGGYIAGGTDLIEILRFSAPGFVFSVGLPPSMAATALAALRTIRREPDRLRRLRDNGALFQREARLAGMNTGQSLGIGIIPVMVGAPVRAARMVNQLFHRGINASLIIYPGVPISAARLRFFVTSEHSSDEITGTVAALRDAMAKTPSTLGAAMSLVP